MAHCTVLRGQASERAHLFIEVLHACDVWCHSKSQNVNKRNVRTKKLPNLKITQTHIARDFLIDLSDWKEKLIVSV